MEINTTELKVWYYQPLNGYCLSVEGVVLQDFIIVIKYLPSQQHHMVVRREVSFFLHPLTKLSQGIVSVHVFV